MRKTILLSLSLFISIGMAVAQPTCTTDGLASADGWTQIGAGVSVTGGKIKYDDVYCGGGFTQKRIYKSFPSHDLFTLDFTFVPSNWSEAGPADILLAYSAGNLDPETQQTCVRVITNSVWGQTPKIYLDATGVSATVGVEIAKNTTYYVRAERTTPAEVKLSVFSDVARTIHVAGSPTTLAISASLSGFNTLQSGVSFNASDERSLTAELDDITLCEYVKKEENICTTDNLTITEGWTQIGTGVSVTGGKIKYDDVYCGGGVTQKRIYKSFPSHDLFTLDFTFVPSNWSAPGPADILLAYSVGNLDPETQQTCVRVITNSVWGENPKMYVDATGVSATVGIEIAKNTTYYVRAERTTPAEVKLSLFSDAARTIHVAGSPTTLAISASLKGFNTLQSGVSFNANDQRSLTAELDDISLCGPSIVTGIEDVPLEKMEEIYTQLTVLDVNGRLVTQNEWNNQPISTYTQGLSSGIYILKFVGPQAQKVIKVLVKE